MQDTQTTVLRAEIKAFLARSGMSPSYFGKRAANNSELVTRLEAGGSVTLPTAERIRKFIAESDHQPSASPRQPAGRSHST